MEQPNFNRPNQPAPAPLTPPPSHRWGILGGFAVLVLALAAGAYFFLLEKYEVSETPTPPADMTSWKTYTNSEYGFEFKYPDNWITKPSVQWGGYPSVISLISPELQEDLQRAPASRQIPADSDIDFIVTTIADINKIERSNGIQYTSLADYLQRNTVFTGEKQITFNSYPAWSAIEGGMSSYYSIFFEKNGRIYKILFERRIDEASITALENQILSTFKFIIISSLQPLDNTWNLYANVTLGFLIKVPKLQYGTTPIKITETDTSVLIGDNPISWNIRVGKVEDRNALGQFVKSFPYWSQCEIESITPIAGKDYSAVNLKRTDPEGGCFTNYMYALFYSSTLQKAASWTIGQACNFAPSREMSSCYDEEMVKSFKFTQ